MQRRSLLSRLGGGLAVTAATGLAGCSGDESAASAPSETAADTASDSPAEETQEASPSDGMPAASGVSVEVESDVDGLTIVDHGVGAPDGVTPPGRSFVVSLTVENSGEAETDPTDYDYELSLFDEDGTDITPVATSLQPSEVALSPGDRETLALSGLYGEDSESAPDDVARYEVSLSCAGIADGVYCDG